MTARNRDWFLTMQEIGIVLAVLHPAREQAEREYLKLRGRIITQLGFKSRVSDEVILDNLADQVFVILARKIVKKKVGTPFLRVGDLKKPSVLTGRLRDAPDPFSLYLRGRLSSGTRQQLDQFDDTGGPSGALQDALVGDINRWLREQKPLDGQGFAPGSLGEATRRLIEQQAKARGKALNRFKRLILEEEYPKGISKASSVVWVFLSKTAVNVARSFWKSPRARFARAQTSFDELTPGQLSLIEGTYPVSVDPLEAAANATFELELLDILTECRERVLTEKELKILDAYVYGAGEERSRRREALARQLGKSKGALATQVSRIIDKLEDCVRPQLRKHKLL